MPVKLLVCLSVVLMIMPGCSRFSDVKPSTSSRDVLSPPAPVGPGSGHVASVLQQQYSEWAGTPHQWGGMSKQGVDCSGFVHITYRDKLGYSPPRTTKALAQWGRQVDHRRLQPADLLVFRTGIKARHVGIYLGNRQFMHVSSKRGVMISSLDDHYWSQRFWQARRPEGLSVSILPPASPSNALAQCPLPAAATWPESAAAHWPVPAAIWPWTPA